MAEDSQIKVIINDSGGFIVLQIHLAFFSGSQNKCHSLNKEKSFLLYDKSFFNQDGWTLASFFYLAF